MRERTDRARRDLLAAAERLTGAGRTPFTRADLVAEARRAGSDVPEHTLRATVGLHLAGDERRTDRPLVRVGPGRYRLAGAAPPTLGAPAPQLEAGATAPAPPAGAAEAVGGAEAVGAGPVGPEVEVEPQPQRAEREAVGGAAAIGAAPGAPEVDVEGGVEPAGAGTDPAGRARAEGAGAAAPEVEVEGGVERDGAAIGQATTRDAEAVAPGAPQVEVEGAGIEGAGIEDAGIVGPGQVGGAPGEAVAGEAGPLGTGVDAVEVEPAPGWWAATAVRDAVVRAMTADGWRAREVDPAETDAPWDLAVVARGALLLIAVEGLPAGASASAPADAEGRARLADVVLSAMECRSRVPRARVAAAVPDVEAYRALVADVGPALAAARVEVWFVDAEGAVRGAV